MASVKNPSVSSKIGDAKLKIKYRTDSTNSNSDIAAIIKDRVVSVTPLSLDITSDVDFEVLHGILK